MEPINVFDYEIMAEERMNPMYWDYFAGGSDDELTVRTNQSAFGHLRLRPRVLIDVSHCDTRTSVLGIPVPMPILIAPSAFHAMAHPEGECATVQGAGAAGALMIAATDSSRSLEEIAQAASAPLWFQLYLYPTREIAGGLVKRAEAAGYRAIVLTVDMPILGKRERDQRNRMTIPPPPLTRANFAGIKADGHAWRSVTWDDVDWLHTVTSLPIILKGILTPEDALLALEHGVSAIIVSNHGGRQLDSCVTSLEVLPEIVEAVAGRCEIYADGGVRRGTDVLKLLALGARAVLVARPVLWGLAVDGARGVHNVLNILHTELEQAMALTGCPTLASVNRSLLRVIS